ncbi:AfsR/SARP family transcriptional regulator [Williamsia sterculiae]|uniref:Predicted ATPase n=1 Tax=Williamsia sterculiae TaxID=1344003 RepID=A0A1N7G827_9NOCA|nr:BTAD domain-containing putative transcriptional regulator [Williamsia sterculiae]SIS08725.1 Predicted ATPase [Williamsia sterculiae]
MHRIEVRALGALTVCVDETSVSLGGPVPRALLARLVIAEGDVVPAGTLIDELWHGRPPPSATATLQGYVSGLRRVLEPDHGRSAPQVLVRRGTGYVLAVDRAAVDAHRFVDLATAGRELLRAGDPAAARSTLTDALALWTGPAYVDAAGWEFAEIEADRLTALRADVTEDHLAAISDSGDQVAATTELEKLVRTDPLRERAWELLALALYRAGRQGDALDTLRRARAVIADELGADPAPSLAALEQSVLRHDPVLLPDVPAAAPRRVPTSAVPEPLTPMVGRDDQVAQVQQLLTGHRLVTITGPGGMGKTRVAVEVARRRDDPDGPWFVELAGAADLAALLDTVSGAVGLTFTGGIGALSDLLRDRRLLLVLDNCEHLLDEVAEFCTRMLVTCPQIRVLATSRTVLGVAGEHRYPLTGLDASTQLFLDRAGDGAAGVDHATVARLCTALDDMPLAIELAAAQTTMLSVPQIIDMLDDRFAVLRGGPRTNDRHVTMQAAIDGSFASLDDSARALFVDLAVFDGGFDLATAMRVTGRPSLLADLTALVDSSMVTALGGDPRRYRLLETLREYAIGHRDAQRSAAVQRAHTDWVRAVAAEAYLALRGPDCLRWTQRLEADMPNIRAALGRARDDATTYLEIAGNVYWYWYRRGHVAEGMRALEPALRAPADIPVTVTIRALAGRAIMSYLGADLPALFEALTALDVLYTGLDTDDESPTDDTARGDAAVTLAFFQAGAGAVDVARERAGIAMDIGLRHRYPWTVAESLMALGTADFRAGDHAAAGVHFDRALAVAEECGYDWCAASVSWLHAKSEIAQQLIGGPAETRLAGMIAYCKRAFDLTSWMVAMSTLAYVLYLRGEHERAGQLLGVVERRTDLTGFSPEGMDVVELADYGKQMRAGIDPVMLATAAERGRELTGDAIDALVAWSVVPVVVP